MKIRILIENFKIKIKSFKFPKFVDIEKEFPLFSPNSAGSFNQKSKITVSTINNLVPFLNTLMTDGFRFPSKDFIDLKDFSMDDTSIQNEIRLKQLFTKYGSDKSSIHNYELLYTKILGDGTTARNILEIGLGTANSDVVSNMGVGGTPGGSLRAFRDYCPSADIYGADVDKRILFTENRIKTFYVDQTNSISLSQLLQLVPNNFDLVIDDGLHSPDANIATLNFGIKVIRTGGWIVIEDIKESAINLWKLVGQIFPDNFDTYLIKSKSAFVFAVQKKY